MTLQEMIARQKQITEQARNAGRNLTEEEQQEFDELQRKITLSAPAGKPGTGDTGAATSNQGERGKDGAEAGVGQDPPDEGQRATLAERMRITEIDGLCRRFGLDPSQYISRGDTMEQVRASVLEQLERTHSPVSVRVTADAEDKHRAAIVDGILLRNNIPVDKPAAGANDFKGASLRMIAASCLSGEDRKSVV